MTDRRIDWYIIISGGFHISLRTSMGTL